MTTQTRQPETKDPRVPSGADAPTRPPSAEQAGLSLAKIQTTMFKDVLKAQLTALESLERLMASTGPASEDLMNQFSREFILGLFRLYPVGQEMGRHSFSAMTELTKEFSTVLRSALDGIDGNGTSRPGGGTGTAGTADSVPT